MNSVDIIITEADMLDIGHRAALLLRLFDIDQLGETLTLILWKIAFANLTPDQRRKVAELIQDEEFTGPAMVKLAQEWLRRGKDES